MAELLLKFEMLDAVDKQHLLEFLNYLLAKKQQSSLPKKFNYKTYRKKIQAIGTWSDGDISAIEAARQNFNSRQAPTW